MSAASQAKRRTAASRTSLVEAASFFASRCNRYRSTTLRFNAKRGSEQYHSMNSSMACRYDRRDCSDVRLLRTDLSVWSSSGRAGRSVRAFFRVANRAAIATYRSARARSFICSVIARKPGATRNRAGYGLGENMHRFRRAAGLTIQSRQGCTVHPQLPRPHWFEKCRARARIPTTPEFTTREPNFLPCICWYAPRGQQLSSVRVRV